jgi:hypothetical protein
MVSHPLDDLRQRAANVANQMDAELWRWFCLMCEERRIQWGCSDGKWFVSVDNRHVSTEPDFDSAIRNARGRHASSKARRLRAKVKRKPPPPEIYVTIGVGRVKCR